MARWLYIMLQYYVTIQLLFRVSCLSNFVDISWCTIVYQWSEMGPQYYSFRSNNHRSDTFIIKLSNDTCLMLGKPGNQKAEMTWDEPKTMSWLNLQTKRFGFFKKSLGVMCWQGISSIWLCQHIKYSIVFAFLVVKMKANEKPRHESFTI